MNDCVDQWLTARMLTHRHCPGSAFCGTFIVVPFSFSRKEFRSCFLIFYFSNSFFLSSLRLCCRRYCSAAVVAPCAYHHTTNRSFCSVVAKTNNILCKIEHSQRKVCEYFRVFCCVFLSNFFSSFFDCFFAFVALSTMMTTRTSTIAGGKFLNLQQFGLRLLRIIARFVYRLLFVQIFSLNHRRLIRLR